MADATRCFSVPIESTHVDAEYENFRDTRMPAERRVQQTGNHEDIKRALRAQKDVHRRSGNLSSTGDISERKLFGVGYCSTYE